MIVSLIQTDYEKKVPWKEYRITSGFVNLGLCDYSSHLFENIVFCDCNSSPDTWKLASVPSMKKRFVCGFNLIPHGMWKSSSCSPLLWCTHKLRTTSILVNCFCMANAHLCFRRGRQSLRPSCMIRVICCEICIGQQPTFCPSFAVNILYFSSYHVLIQWLCFWNQSWFPGASPKIETIPLHFICFWGGLKQNMAIGISRHHSLASRYKLWQWWRALAHKYVTSWTGLICCICRESSARFRFQHIWWWK